MADAPTAPEPDGKDWTWVVERTCPECGFEAGTFPLAELTERIRGNAAEWAAILSLPRVAERPESRTWSALEYAAHVRDVNHLYDERLEMMLTQDGPHYPNWDQDVTAIEERYDLQDPATVARELRASADALAARFETVAGDMWERTGLRSDGAAFTVETFARYYLHDPVHHLVDARNGLVALDS